MDTLSIGGDNYLWTLTFFNTYGFNRKINLPYYSFLHWTLSFLKIMYVLHK
jgi:hypothetical protein